MSYCRWSSENGYCDVYVYADVNGGWTTHVASLRPQPGAPESGIDAMWKHIEDEDKTPDELANIYREAQDKRDAWDKKHPHVKIKHAEAGKSYNHPTPGACADNLERLRKEGFVVPQYAIDDLREEDREQE